MNKRIKIILMVLIFLISWAALFLTVQWWSGHQVKQLIEDKIPELTRGAYSINIEKASVEFLSRSVRLHSVSISTNNISPGDTLPWGILQGKIEEVEAEGIYWEREQESGQIAKISASLLALHASSLSLHQPQAKDTLQYNLKGLDFRIQDLTYRPSDSREAQYAGSNLSGHHIQLNLRQFQHIYAGGDYILAGDSIQLDSEQNSLDLAALTITPQGEKSQFSYHSYKHIDWTRYELGRISCTGVDVNHWMASQEIFIDSIHIARGNISSYKNRKINQPKVPKKLFYESLYTLPVHFDIRRLILDNTYVSYEELAVRGEKPGKVFFTDIRGDFYRLTNHPMPAHTAITLSAKGKLMGQGEIDATLLFPINDLYEPFRAEGSLSAIPAQAMNDVLIPLAGIEVTSGKVHSLHFHMTGNTNEANVSLQLLYDDLHVAFLKKFNSKANEKVLLTEIANLFVLKSSNPQHHKTRTGEGSFTRDPYRSQYHYFWKTLLEGVKGTLM